MGRQAPPRRCGLRGTRRRYPRIVAAKTDVLELGLLALSSGEGRRVDSDVALDGLEFGGQRYDPTPSVVPARLDVARTVSGYSVRLRLEAGVVGPCTRCLTDAAVQLSIDAREVDQPGAGDEVRSPYVAGDELDVRSWARDALALAMPTQILCRDDCLGLCAVCGEDLNDAGEGHGHEPAPDARWSKLSELRLD